MQYRSTRYIVVFHASMLLAMTTLQWMPVGAYAVIVGIVLVVALRNASPGSREWLVPLFASILFIPFSGYTVVVEGLGLFWSNHTNNLSGNQVWFDLILATAVGFYLVAPRARAVGMNVAGWGVATVLTASVALLPMLSRVLWLEGRSARAPVADG